MWDQPALLTVTLEPEARAFKADGEKSPHQPCSSCSSPASGYLSHIQQWQLAWELPVRPTVYLDVLFSVTHSKVMLAKQGPQLIPGMAVGQHWLQEGCCAPAGAGEGSGCTCHSERYSTQTGGQSGVTALQSRGDSRFTPDEGGSDPFPSLSSRMAEEVAESDGRKPLGYSPPQKQGDETQRARGWCSTTAGCMVALPCSHCDRAPELS